MIKPVLCFLHCQIQEMVRENDNLPEQHFNLDVEEQRRLEAMVEQEVTRVQQILMHQCNESITLL